MERKMLEGKLVLVGNDGVPLKHLNANRKYTMEPFLSLYESFGSPNTSTKEDTVVDKSNGTVLGSYVNRLNGDPSKKISNFHTLIAPAGNGADVPIFK
jgi:hypothetical protein